MRLSNPLTIQRGDSRYARRRYQATCLSSDVVGSAVYVTGNPTGEAWAVASADPTDSDKMHAVGVIVSKSTDTTCEILIGGLVEDVYVGLSPGRPYFVVDGGISLTQPTENAQIIGVAQAEDVLWLSNDYSGSSSSASAGGVFIREITSSGNTSVSYRPAPNEASALSVTTDDYDMDVTVEWDRTSDAYQGLPTVNGVEVTRTSSQTPGATFVGTATISGLVTEIVALFGTASYTVPVVEDPKPVVSDAEFTGVYPTGPTGVIQTEVKNNDEFSVYVAADIAFDRVEVENSSALKQEVFVVSQGLNATVVATIDATGSSPQSLGGRVRVRTPSGSWGEWFDITNTVVCNDLAPSISIGTKTYPVGQQALKDSDLATVVNTISGWSAVADEVLYTSPGGELFIQNETSYDSPKNVMRIGGSYNVSTSNFRIVATRVANGSQDTENSVVYIANVLPVIGVSIVGASRMRTGGNDGTPVQSYTIRISSSQLLASPPLLSKDSSDDNSFGTFSGSGSTWNATYQADDDNPVGVFSWESLSATNLSGMVQTSIASGADYEVGGFVSRTIAIAGSVDNGEINVSITEWSSKVVFSWTADPTVVIRGVVGDTTQYLQDTWTIDALDTLPTRILIQDTSAALSSTDVSYVTLEEAE